MDQLFQCPDMPYEERVGGVDILIFLNIISEIVCQLIEGLNGLLFHDEIGTVESSLS